MSKGHDQRHRCAALADRGCRRCSMVAQMTPDAAHACWTDLESPGQRPVGAKFMIVHLDTPGGVPPPGWIRLITDETSPARSARPTARPASRRHRRIIAAAAIRCMGGGVQALCLTQNAAAT